MKAVDCKTCFGVQGGPGEKPCVKSIGRSKVTVMVELADNSVSMGMMVASSLRTGGWQLGIESLRALERN